MNTATVKTRTRRRGSTLAAAALAALIVLAGCSGGDDDASVTPTPTAAAAPEPTVEVAAPTPTATPGDPTPTPSPTSTPTPVVVPEFDGDDAALPIDQDVIVGTLDNGLRYYIRNNTAPGTRAELRLVVDAGSALEDDDQSGVAHFLEHMLFNGTERYPSNELVALLESFGSEFGPDVNAYTAFDETVYSLSVPTDDSALFVEAFDVLLEWASRATIDADEVIAERGVVLEEWRLRDQGVGGRVGSLFTDLLLADTPYEGRLPIGEPDAISATTAAVVQRYYRDWYRPDLMAVVAVGDFEPAAVEQLITERFAALEGPADPRPVPSIIVDSASEVAFTSLADPELSRSFVEVVFPGPSADTTTVGAYRQGVAYAVASSIINERFSDDVSRGGAPYLDAGSSAGTLGRALDTPGLRADAPAGALEDSLEALLVELERVRRDGFESDEFDRAVDAYRAEIEQAFAGRITTQDFAYASEYVENYLGDAPMLSWDDFIELELRVLDELTPEYVQLVYLASIDGRSPQVVIAGPLSDEAALPDEATVRAVFDAVASTDVPPRVDDARDIDSLMDPPEPAPVAERSTIAELDATRLVFDNGVTVLLKQTDISENGFALAGSNPGGNSVLDVDDLAAAWVGFDVVGQSGVGDLSQVELDRLLSDRVVSGSASFAEVDESISGGGASDDAEIVLQLIHLYLTEPRATDSALATAVGEVLPFARDASTLPFIAPTLELLDIRFGGSPRFFLLPPAADLEALTAADVVRVFRSSLGDATGSAFAIAGDFDLADMEDLAARYLGTLPSDGVIDEYVDQQPDPPDASVEREVRVGQDPQGRVSVLISAEVASDLETDIELQALQNLVSARIRDRLREALGATYSPTVAISSEDRPDDIVDTFIEVTGDPERVPEIVDEIKAIIADLGAGVIDETEVATAREQVRRDFELVSNGFWLDQLIYAATHPDVTMLTVPERIRTAGSITRDDLVDLAARVFPPDQLMIVSLLPAA